MFSPEERQRAVELYFTTPMTTAQVVKRLGYPTRQCLERWLAADPRYAGHMAKPIIPLETRTKAIELVLGGMQQKQAARQLGVSIGAVHNWVKAYREGGMAALQPRNRNASQSNKPAPRRSRNAGDGNDDAEALRRRVEELELENALMREVVEVVKKDPGAVYFVKLRWTCSALNLNTVGVQLEHRRRLVPCFVVCLVYFMRECLFR